MTVSTVGNDVVDLLDPRTSGKHADERFVKRVLAAPERAFFAEAGDPAAQLWALWAAKEAAYKVVSKLLGVPPVFVHAAFRVSWSDVVTGRWTGSVVHEDVVLPVVATRHDTMMHAVATSGPDPGDVVLGAEALAEPPTTWEVRLAEVLPSLTPLEADAVHSFPSAAVRLRAKHALAEVLHADEAAIQIVCDPGVMGRRPPRVLLDGRPAPVDVSLSHHGTWIAWAALAQNAPGR